MISYQDALTEGMAIAKKSSKTFFKKNEDSYNRLGFEAGDLEGYLYEETLVKKYLPNIEKNPGFYETIGKFKASFYTACRNSLLVHHQANVKCKKRGDILRSGVVELDATFGEEEQGTTLGVEGGQDYTRSVKEMVDACVQESGCPDWEVARPLTILAYGIQSGKCVSKSDLRKTLADLGKTSFERLWEAICTHMQNFTAQAFGSEIYPAYQ